MVIKFVFFICLFFFSSLSIAQTNSHAHHKQAPTKKEAETNKMLIENKGQWPSSVLFRTNMTGGKVWLQQKKNDLSPSGLFCHAKSACYAKSFFSK